MLFDLRGRGRRRSVQTIYVALAVLMGGGLIFFGIGGSVSGGLAGEVVASAQPSAIAYFNLAVLAYSAGQTRKGDLAAQKAVQKSPAADRPSVKSQLDALKKQGGASTGSAGASAVSPSG